MRRLLTAVLLSLSACTATTGSTEVGVRVAKVPLLEPRGVEPTFYGPGSTYFFFRPFSDWSVYDVALQNLVMVRRGPEGADHSLRFKTIDGNDVSVDVTVAWRIEPTKAPYLAQFIGQTNFAVESKLVRPVSRSVIRDVLNQLTSEEYYQAERRFKVADAARQRLNEVLGGEGIVVEQVLLGEHAFNPEYEQIIKDKKVAEQEADRLVSETEAAAEEMKRDLEQAKGRVSQLVEEALGEAEKKRLEADAIYFRREKAAEAILAERKAKAEGLQKKAEALAGAGGIRQVKLALAAALQGKKILFLPAGGGMDVRTTDMNTLLQAYGLSTAAPPKKD